MSRSKLVQEEKKVNTTVTLNPAIYNKINELQNNKSKYIERLIYNDLVKNNHLDKDMIL